MKIPNDLLKLIKKRDENSNKGDYGRTLLVCGSYKMLGAAVISARACVLSGVGICDIAMQQEIYQSVSMSVPEAVCTPLSKEFNIDDKISLLNSMKKCNSIVFGCGMGISDYTRKILRFLIENSKVPLLIDADGLNCLAEEIDLLKIAKCQIIITPHPAEMGRLIGKSAVEINSDRIGFATSFSKKYGVITLLKGHNTVISDEKGEYTINTTGNSGMATGGSGDMLSGIIGALLSSGQTPYDATRLSAFIHGLSGDITAEKYSKTSTCPALMLKTLPKIYKKIEESL